MQHVVGGAGIGGQFQHDELARAQVRRDRAGAVFLTKERSGSRWRVSGVGTQMMITSQAARSRKIGGGAEAPRSPPGRARPLAVTASM